MPFSGISSIEFYVPNNKISLQTQTTQVKHFTLFQIYAIYFWWINFQQTDEITAS